MNGKPAPLFFIVAAFAAFAVALDLRTLQRTETPRRARLARHVWRMGAALFVASGSFFLGQQKVMPAWMQGSPVLLALALALAPLAVMAVWLARLALGRPKPVLAPA